MNSAPETSWLKLWRAAFILLVGLWLGWALVGTEFQPELLSSLWFQWQSWLFLAGWVLLPAALGILWWWSLRFSFGVRLPVPTAFRIQGLAWGGRYLPGKAGIWLAKVSIAGDHGANIRSLSHSVLVEQGLFVLSGIVVGIGLLPWNLILGTIGWENPLWHWAQQNIGVKNLVAVQIFLVCGMTLAGFVGLFMVCRVFGVESRRRDIPVWLVIYAGYCVIHVLLGLALYPLIDYMAAESAVLLGVSGVVATLALANSLGILAVFAPAGLGVREVVLAGLLAVAVPYSVALGIAAVLRVLTLVADVIFTLFAWIFGSIIDSKPQSKSSYHETLKP